MTVQRSLTRRFISAALAALALGVAAITVPTVQAAPAQISSRVQVGGTEATVAITTSEPTRISLAYRADLHRLPMRGNDVRSTEDLQSVPWLTRHMRRLSPSRCLRPSSTSPGGVPAWCRGRDWSHVWTAVSRRH